MSDSPAGRLAALLAYLADSAGKSTRDLARVTGKSQSTMHRVYIGKRLPRRAEVEGWLQVCAATESEIEQVWELFRQAHAGSVSWVSDDPTIPQVLVDDLTREASTVWVFSPAAVPGLLQTAEYARVAIGLDPAGRTDQTDAFTRRMNRQRVLYDPDRRFRFVVSQRALFRGLGAATGVLEVQRAHLRSLAARPNVEVLVLPEDSGIADVVPFSLYADRSDGPDTVTIEAPHGMIPIPGADEVDVYRALFVRLADVSRGV